MHDQGREGSTKSHLVNTIALQIRKDRGIILKSFSIYDKFLYFVTYVSVFCKR